MYNKRVWLNPKKSASSGSMICFDGQVHWRKDPEQSIFLELADCQGKIRLHTTMDESEKDFVRKLKIIKKEVGKFIKYLEDKK